jgi:HEAT repeat protein
VSPDYDQLSAEVKSAKAPDIIYRAAAVGGRDIVSALRQVSKTDATVDSVSGAAQVSLARLGDKDTVEQLGREINETKYPSAAVRKLVRVGNDRAISILMAYLAAHLHDNSLVGDLGDYGYDLRSDITDLLAKQLQLGPIAQNHRFSVAPEDWVEWWNHNKGKPVALSISGDLQDPYLQCLARKVEWGFPNAVLDMANSADPAAMPVFKKLTLVGDIETPRYAIGTLRGNAVFALAKLGDEKEFREIVDVLNGIGDSGVRYRDAIEYLRLIGGKKSFSALINALDNPNFLSDYVRKYPGVVSLSDVIKDRDARIMSALGSMVAGSRPDSSGSLDERKSKWKEWWARSKDTAQFVLPPVRTYE